MFTIDFACFSCYIIAGTNGLFVILLDFVKQCLFYVLKIPVVAMCTASLTSSNSTFCPHSVFVYFGWI
jgi:hypothetical protein